MLYRCFAFLVGAVDDEVTVFFQPRPGAHIHTFITEQLAALWHVPAEQVEVYNVFSEDELLGGHAAGPVSTGDARLFETGSGGPDPIHYARNTHTLLLVRPAMLQRLVKAQGNAAALRVFHRTPRGERSLLDYWQSKLPPQKGPLTGAPA